MSMPRYAARRDKPESGIIDGLEACGWECVRLNSGDLPDLLCRKRSTGELRLLEIESGEYKRRRSDTQRAMLAAWAVPIVKNFEEAIRALGSKIS